LLGDLRADSVIAACAAAEAHDQGASRIGHVVSICRSRKWVAQEMHGS
jgi:hypothetical protein